MTSIDELAERFKSIFNKVGGSNYAEHHPYCFKITGERAKEEPTTLHEEYSRFLIDVATFAMENQYTVSDVSNFEDKDRRRKLIHPSDVEVKSFKHDYYFNFVAFDVAEDLELPLLSYGHFDFRKADGRSNDETSVHLRFPYGTKENQLKMFNTFEAVIANAGFEYERRYPKRELESVHFDIPFKSANPNPSS